MPVGWLVLILAHMTLDGMPPRTPQDPALRLKLSARWFSDTQIYLTTQRYLGKVSDTEAIKWIENIHG
jgi:hypothetical protein